MNRRVLPREDPSDGPESTGTGGQGSLPYPARKRGRILTNVPESFECGRCAETFPTLRDFDTHRNEERRQP